MNRRLDPKRQGEIAELIFMRKALALGARIARPWSESSRYDFIVDFAGRLTRVQVKSVAVPQRDAYPISAASGHGSKRAYTRRDIDLLAAYVIPADAWYLIPVSAFSPVKTIRLCPHRPSRRRFEAFREAWHLLRS